jgi:L-lactate dehydrogenase complex protein LldG
MTEPADPFAKIRRALGRTAPLASVPPPPQITSIARLVGRDADLKARFIKSATEAHFEVEQVAATAVAGMLSEFLRANQCRRIGLSAGGLLERLQIAEALRREGLDVATWDTLSSDGAYDLDCGVTDVWAAVAETGSLVIRPDEQHGRLLSLAPPIHVALVQPQQIVADLIDLMELIDAAGRAPNITLITGPSKTADIEGALVTGVHGPGVVKVMVVEMMNDK